MTEIVRTPEERFADLPGYPWQAKYFDWSADGERIRLARVDEGEGEPVVLFHGEPTWSYLYRKMIPTLLDAGLRCVAPDFPGFGRSDKPADLDWYSYDRHTEAMAALLDDAGVEGATFVVQDWGGPIGMRVAVEQPHTCARLVVMDTGFFDGGQRMTDAWRAFRDFVERTEDLPISFLVKGACHSEPTEEVLAAYDAPYPDAAAKAGARAFPLMLPTDPDAPGAAEGRRTRERIAEDDRPVLTLWAEHDFIIPPELGRKMAERIGWPEPEVIAGASHFLQEDQGERIAERIVSWLGEQPRR